jgi:hypothetical protein
MNDETTRRVSDQGLGSIAIKTVKDTGCGFWDWIEKRHIAAHASIAVTLWLTIRVIEWAIDFADANVIRDSNSVGIILGAVLTPWGIMQAAMFKFYSDSIKSNKIT